MKQRKGLCALLIVLAVLIIDQITKIYVKTHFSLGESVDVTSWFKILFIENNGMAFGMEIGSKVFLTLIRLVVSFIGIYYIWKIKDNPRLKMGFLISLSLIIAGAMGNNIDGLFYGMMFDDPYPPEVASFMPESGGYAGLFYGKVVDMLYFPLFSFVWPDWVPGLGGDTFLFFQPVFNIADAAISVGICLVIFFYSSQINDLSAKDEETEKAE